MTTPLSDKLSTHQGYNIEGLRELRERDKINHSHLVACLLKRMDNKEWAIPQIDGAWWANTEQSSVKWQVLRLRDRFLWIDMGALTRPFILANAQKSSKNLTK